MCGGVGAVSSAPVATPPSLLASRKKHKRAASWADNINFKYWPHYLKKFHSFNKNNQSKLHNSIYCVAKFIAINERQYTSLSKHFTFSQRKRASFIRWVSIVISHNDQSKWNLATRPITFKIPRFPWNSVKSCRSLKGNYNSKIKAIFKPYDVTSCSMMLSILLSIFFIQFWFLTIPKLNKVSVRSARWAGGVDGGRGVDEGAWSSTQGFPRIC